MKINYFTYVFTYLFIINKCYSNYLDGLEVSKCAEYKIELSNITSETSYCFVKSSQPLRICTECYSQFTTFSEKYSLLINKKINQGTISCYDILLQSDITTSLEDVYHTFLTIWEQVNCPQCYNKNGNFTEDYIKFIKLEKSVMECLQNYTDASLRFTDPNFETIWNGYNFSNAACDKCSDKYKEIIQFYHEMQEKTIKNKTHLWEGVCGDLGDMLNTTRYLWSKCYKCDIHSAEIVLISPVVAILGITLLFYCIASTYFHDKMRTVLYKQRRLRHFSKDFGPDSLLETLK